MKWVWNLHEGLGGSPFVVGFVTQTAIDVAYIHYKSETAAFGYAADCEAHDHVMRLLVDRVSTGRHQLCDNITFGEAAKRVRRNQESDRMPYLGVLEKCDAKDRIPRLEGTS